MSLFCTGGGEGLGFGGCGAALVGAVVDEGAGGCGCVLAPAGISVGKFVSPGAVGSFGFVGSVGNSAIKNYQSQAVLLCTKVPYFLNWCQVILVTPAGFPSIDSG